MTHSPQSKARRVDTAAAAATADAVAAEVNRLATCDWPNRAADGVTVVSVDRKTLIAKHDGPHKSSAIEWWYINGHFGDTTPPRFSFFVAFFRFVPLVDSIKNAAAEAAAGTPLATSTLPPHLHFANWALVDTLTKKYHRFSITDPELIAMVLSPATHEFEEQAGANPHIVAAVRDLARKGQLPRPDRLMPVPAKVNAADGPASALAVEYDGCSLRAVPGSNDSATGTATYELVLSGRTFEGGCDDSEATAITLKAAFRGRFAPALHGIDGVVSVGVPVDDTFYYFTPSCEVLPKSLSLAINGEEMLKNADGGDGAFKPIFWLDHQFGMAHSRVAAHRAFLAKTRAEHPVNACNVEWHWAALQLNDGTSVSATLLRDGANHAAKPMAVLSVVQHADGRVCSVNSKTAPNSQVIIEARDPRPPAGMPGNPPPGTAWWKSPGTGQLFPTAWRMAIPDYDTTVTNADGTKTTVRGTLKLLFVATIPDQEMISICARPSYWEGRVDIDAAESGVYDASTGTQRLAPVGGVGFMEMRPSAHADEAAKAFDGLAAMLCGPVAGQLTPAVVNKADPGANVPLVAPFVGMLKMMSAAMGAPPIPPANERALTCLLAAFATLAHHFGPAAVAADPVASATGIAAVLSWADNQWDTAVTTIDFPTLCLRGFWHRVLDPFYAIVAAK